MKLLAAVLGLLVLFLSWLYGNTRLQLNRRSRFGKKLEEEKTRLEKMAQAAGEEKKRLFAILESMAEGVLVVDTEARVLLVNSALENYFSIKKESSENRYFWEIFRDAEMNQMMERGLRERAVLKQEHSTPLSSSVFEIQVLPVFLSREFLGVVGVFRDITVLKEFERLRTEFVANVSHELKTPLTSILGFVETLKEGGVEDAQNRMKFLQIIEEQSKQLHHLIEDLLLLSTLESSKDPLRAEEVNIEQMFRKTEELFLPLIREKRIEWKMDTPANALRISAEASSLERALCNLAANALKYNRPGGSVSLRAFESDGKVVLEVSDTGCGIAPADQERVFERFFLVDKSRSRESGGTGLGLSIAKHIVERHGGRIGLRSALGEGSTFSIILPRQKTI